MLVAVRLRPLNKKEIDHGVQSCCEVINNSVVAIKKAGNGGYLKSEQTAINDYQYDICFDENSSQNEIYEGTAKKFIPSLISGLNVTGTGYTQEYILILVYLTKSFYTSVLLWGYWLRKDSYNAW